MRTYAQQKAALTRAINSGDPDKVIAEVERAKDEWDRGDWVGSIRPGAWPDDWTRWERANGDALSRKIDGFLDRLPGRGTT